MRLAIGTAHRACSLALIDGSKVVKAVHEIIGRGHAERLIPMIAALLGETRPGSIVVEIGPGSFTGMRVGIAAARALGVAWDVPVSGITSTEVLAARAFRDHADLPEITVALDGGRGEVFVQHFTRDGGETGPPAAVPAEQAAIVGGAVIGTGTPMIVIPAHVRVLGTDMPDMADVAALIPPAGQDRPPAPLYVRAPDAKPPQR
ncbi:tRNA (adenosine(37)-N6)-threonylcarbamoyltransferase complex dimerization subunit type 1 TsaB [Pacificimonas sp. WHA3]|uniref:tRNA (Adenosine(37)-N6)-threonylcarbamoyltransferase complex dimerization subunit type 1 TsaB n=1 Tax=Pacificimonas pallii TaxID=2827236 RepID=A0ABS6SD15_9SPHN|nr:tRNA (adenosine(37)-N6)-threonylcarbamoyltransferase complex dimerization subunit type 1 TsaB [Pacificimonas pallii]MBV7256302.1 tRNA (adenosine(37)-N6)-threonylcarbamoyltransferase complex dimerization subunit type 1 TsaB [Pacificimonas pallii]